MGRIDKSEIRVGLVIHLDTDQLRVDGRCETNAEHRGSSDRAVTGPHYFLVVHTELGTDGCIAIPLFSSFAPGSLKLDEPKKSGMPAKWRGQDSFYSKWQHWRIPCDALIAASAMDEAETATRRHYARDDLPALEAISAWQLQNRAPWRRIT